MSFIYRAPLQFVVSANVDGSHLRFNDDAVALIKYVDEDPSTDRTQIEEPAKVSGEEAARGGGSDRRHHHHGSPCELPIRAAWRRGTALDPRWWKLYDLGPTRTSNPELKCARLARLEFNGSAFARHIADGCHERHNLALYDAFLEQDTIQLDVELERECVASLILAISYQ